MIRKNSIKLGPVETRFIVSRIHRVSTGRLSKSVQIFHENDPYQKWSIENYNRFKIMKWVVNLRNKLVILWVMLVVSIRRMN